MELGQSSMISENNDVEEGEHNDEPKNEDAERDSVTQATEQTPLSEEHEESQASGRSLVGDEDKLELEVDELERLQDDIRAKQTSSGVVGFDQVPGAFHGYNAALIEVAASVPGAFSIDGKGVGGEYVFKTQEQMKGIARLRTEQKTRTLGREPETGATRQTCGGDTSILDGLQESMQAYLVETKVEDEHVIESKRKAMLFWGLLAILVLVGVVIFVIIVAKGKESGTSNAEAQTPSKNATVSPPKPAPFPWNLTTCLEATEESERFVSIRSKLLADFPDLAGDIDSVGSSMRAGLCWMADHDPNNFTLTCEDSKACAQLGFLQRFAVVAMYHHFVAEESNLSVFDGSGWLGNSAECDWDYLVCDEETSQVIRQLLLRKIELTGSIPTELALLTDLQFVDLGLNSLTGELPSELWSLTQLSYLALEGNLWDTIEIT